MLEIFANRYWDNQISVSLWNGSALYQMDMNRRFGTIRNGLNQPELDNFVLESTVQTIKTKKPNLLLVHFTDLDTQRHLDGFSSTEAYDAIRRHDQRLGRIIHALRECNLYDCSTIVALGDHSALDESQAVKPNVLLRKKGLITVNDAGKVTDWQAYCKSCDGSAYLYVKEEAIKAVNLLLDSLLKEEASGIEKVRTGTEAAVMGADSTAIFMIGAKCGYYFTEGLNGAYIDTITKEDVEARRYTFASHGYSPEKDQYTTVFMAARQGIRQNIVLPTMHLVDEGPTFARLLGLDLGKTDGLIRTELLSL